MRRKELINKLKEMAPVITSVTCSEDMGFEFSAVVPNGVVYAEPGMLLSYSDGAWPPDIWEYKTDDDYQKLMNDFLLNGGWNVTAWENLNEGELRRWCEDVENIQSG